MSATIKVVHYGCGPIGGRLAKLVSQRKNLQIVGAIDIDEAKVGRDLGELMGSDTKLGVVVSKDAEAVLKDSRADVVLHSTSSSLNTALPQFRQIIQAGSNIVSTCEELSFPEAQNSELGKELDQLAKRHNVTVLGTGVNPGFVMDAWVIAVATLCQDVQRVQVTRVVDASTRRQPLQKKIGAGLSVEEFKKLVQAKTVRHVGLTESIAMIAASLGWKLDEIDDTVEPAVAETRVKSEYITVEPGQAAGVRQIGRGFKDGKEVITLDLSMYIGAQEPHDTVKITGTPDLETTFKGGVPGDIATASVVVNCISRVVEAQPGLVTMKDLTLPGCTAGA
ncbi:MAG: dihydrodipicolinate reductase [Dehalococcoidia bacterium]